MVNAFAKAVKVLGEKDISVAVRGQYDKGENAKVVGTIRMGGVAEVEDLEESDNEDGDNGDEEIIEGGANEDNTTE